MSLVNVQAEFLLDVCKLIDFSTKQGFVITGGELERKVEMQEIYIKTGRSKTMNSMHLKKCAIDLNFFKEINGRLQLTYDVTRKKGPGSNSLGILFWTDHNKRTHS